MLQQLVEAARAGALRREADLSEAALRARVASLDQPPSLTAALARPGVSVIAEIKRASPSRGALNPRLDAAATAVAYARAGAAAISVLTEETRFGGSLADLQAAAQALAAEGLPVPLLAKGFYTAPYQLLEARAAGASAALLIVAAVDDGPLAALHDAALDLGLTPLVEVHDARELVRALALRPSVVGINNRDLTTLRVDPATTTELRPLVPDGVLMVAESGIADKATMRTLATLRVDAALIGEALVTAPNPAQRLRALIEAGR